MTDRSRIERLVADGLITEAQGERLLRSLQPPVAETPSPRRQRYPRQWHWWLAGGVVLLAALLFFNQPDPGAVQQVADSLNDPGSVGAMPKSSAVISLLLILIIPFLILVYLFNSLVDQEEAVNAAWSDVESNYQRRADLVPRLVESVSRYLSHESDTLTEVVRQRNSALRQAIDELVERQADSADALAQAGREPPTDEAHLSRLSERDQALRGALRGLMLVVEDYPELRSADQMLQLQAQLEGSENRINVARIRFNDSVEQYNASIRRMPGSLVAGLGSFQRKAYFKADAGASHAQPLDL